MDNRVRFSDSIYKHLQEDIDNRRAKKIIDLYNDLIDLSAEQEDEKQ